MRSFSCITFLKTLKNRLENTEESRGKVIFFFKHCNSGQILLKVTDVRHSLTKTLRFNQKSIELSHFSNLPTTQKDSSIMF